jgi:hypothetical protein
LRVPSDSFVDFDTGEISQWAIKMDRGQLEIQVLEQNVDSDAIRSSVVDPHTTYSPDRFSVISAIRAELNAAASLNVDSMMVKYNQKAKALYEENLKHRIKHNTNEFIRLFGHVDSEFKSGMILLQPVKSTEKNTVIDGCDLPGQSIHDSKRVKLVHNNPHTQEGIIFVPTFQGADLGEEAAAFPQIGIPPTTEYRIIAGSVSSIPISFNDMLVVLKTTIGTTRVGIGEDEFPVLVDEITANEITSATNGFTTNFDFAIAKIRDACRMNRLGYFQKVHDLYDRYNRIIRSDAQIRAFEHFAGIKGNFDNAVLFYYREDGENRYYTLESLKNMTQPVVEITSPPVESDGSHMLEPVVALTNAYRPLVQKEQNAVRYRLHLMAAAGMAPALVGGEDNMGQFNVDEDEGGISFEASMKRVEYDLKVKSVAGYIRAFRVVAKLVLDSLFATLDRPKQEDVPSVGEYNLVRQTGAGFIFVPSASDSIQRDVRYQANLRLPIYSTSQYDFMRSYPNWTDYGNPVSSASLLLWRHAVSRCTIPFARSTRSNLDDVAAMLAHVNPFPIFKGEYQKIASGMLSEIMSRIETDVLVPEKMIHMVQITDEEMTPGNLDFAQQFTPMMITFSGASVKKQTNETFKIAYTLGTESTELLESIVIATALLKTLVYKQPRVKVEHNNVPPVIDQPVSFPGNLDDMGYKSTLAKKNYDLSGPTNSFFTTLHTHGSVGIEMYMNFIGMGPKNINKAGRAVFSHESGPEGSVKDVLFAPGFYPNVGIPQGGELEPSESLTMFDLKQDDLFGKSRIDKRTKYDDYIAHELVYSDIHYDHANVRSGKKTITLQNADGSPTSLPVYRRRHAEASVELAAFVNVESLSFTTQTAEGGLAHNIFIVNSLKVGTRQFETKFNIQSVFCLLPNIMGRSRDNPDELKFRDRANYDYFVGLELSPEYSAGYTNSVDGNNDANHIVRMFTINDNSIVTIDDKTWETNMRAYTQNWPLPRPVYFEKTKVKKPTSTIVDDLVDGFEGFHFTNMKSMTRTNFAVAVNAKYREIFDYHNVRENGGPIAINVHNPEPGDKNEANLISMIMSKEAASGDENLASGHRRTGKNRDSLVVPVVVVVEGTYEGSLATPCYLDGYFTKTHLCKIYEGQVVGLLYEHASQTYAGPENKTSLYRMMKQRKDRRFTTLRELVNANRNLIPGLADLMVKLKVQEKTTQRTDKARNRDALVMGQAEIIRLVLRLLYRT